MPRRSTSRAARWSSRSRRTRDSRPVAVPAATLRDVPRRHEDNEDHEDGFKTHSGGSGRREAGFETACRTKRVFVSSSCFVSSYFFVSSCFLASYVYSAAVL